MSKIATETLRVFLEILVDGPGWKKCDVASLETWQEYLKWQIS